MLSRESLTVPPIECSSRFPRIHKRKALDANRSGQLLVFIAADGQLVRRGIFRSLQQLMTARQFMIGLFAVITLFLALEARYITKFPLVMDEFVDAEVVRFYGEMI